MATVATATSSETPSNDVTGIYETSLERPNRHHVEHAPLSTASMVSISLSSEVGMEDASEKGPSEPGTPRNRNTILSQQNALCTGDMEQSSRELEDRNHGDQETQESSELKSHVNENVEEVAQNDTKEDIETGDRGADKQKGEQGTEEHSQHDIRDLDKKDIQIADEEDANDDKKETPEDDAKEDASDVNREHARNDDKGDAGDGGKEDAEDSDKEDAEDEVKEGVVGAVKETNRGQSNDIDELDDPHDVTDQSVQGSVVESVDTKPTSRARSASTGSGSSTRVDWPELENKEQAEPKDQASDESTAFLLAQLEQANNAIATDPKSGSKTFRPRTESRPPSVYQLRKMVEDPTSPNPRFSVLPSPPPMTELEFWTALVQDYPQTAKRLPTLTSNKIRAGVPPPLRGVVWVSMAGARDIELESKFNLLCDEPSPYEGAISKDIGRSFPGVEMFREADGEGQRMLARVLNAFSLYDSQIGYCQGLGFLVGPLLMQMGEREAFCVLIRLMERYDLRCCFLPDLSGLHLRIYQFQQMLAKHMPQLAAHLDSMQVEAAYLSQWFLSLFAVTCPLPMLFRIYDVILAEGASETLMRVAMSLMRRNEKRIMASTEFEEVMQLLLSRSLWEPYCLSADELVNDFVSFTGMVTHEGLATLETKFKAFDRGTANTEGLSPNAQATASSFLGRLWLGSPSTRNTGSLSPRTPGPTGSFLRRSPSKQSMASTLNSVEDASSSNPSSASTNSSATMSDNTEITRNSSADAMSLKSGIDTSSGRATMSSKDRDLHGQIEGLLTALSEMQRDHAVLAMQLQQEREERDEDHRMVRVLLDRLKAEKHHAASGDVKRKSSPWFLSRQPTLAPPPRGHGRSLSAQAPKSAGSQSNSALATDATLPNEVVELVEAVDLRFSGDVGERKPSTQTKQQLRDSLARAKEQLRIESSHFQDLSRQVDEQDKEGTYVRHKLEEVCSDLKQSEEERQRLEQELEELRAEKTPAPCSCNANTPKASKHKRTNSNSSNSSSSSNNSTTSGARRPFRSWRPPSQSMPAIQTQNLTDLQSNGSEAAQNYPKRISSLAAPPVLAKDETEQSERDALLQELVNAKTGEAVARQELEELKAKMEALRRVLGPASAGSSPETPHNHSIGVLGHKSQLSTVSRTETVPVTKHEREDVAKEKEHSRERDKGTKGDEGGGKDEKDHAKENGKEKPKGKELSPQQAANHGSGSGGFWSWGKRSFSSSNVSPPSK